MLDVDGILSPWWDRLQTEYGELRSLRRPHARRRRRSGRREADAGGAAGRARACRARAVVFPMHEPSGYPPANDRVMAAAADSDGRLVAYCRVDPHDDAVAEARRCLDAGARGIKLHPRAEQFTLSAPAVRELVALAHERRVPVLDPRRPRDPGARARHGPPVGRVPGRPADPRPRRDLRPRVAVAGAARTTRTC